MNVEPLRIRPARKTDDLRIAAIWRAAWASANPGASYIQPIEHWLARVRREFWSHCQASVAVRSDEVIAFFVLRAEPHVLEQLCVDPTHQSAGVGTALLDHVKHICAHGFVLYVATSNERAQRFYARHGLEPGPSSINPQSGRPRIQYTFPLPR